MPQGASGAEFGAELSWWCAGGIEAAVDEVPNWQLTTQAGESSRVAAKTRASEAVIHRRRGIAECACTLMETRLHVAERTINRCGAERKVAAVERVFPQAYTVRRIAELKGFAEL